MSVHSAAEKKCRLSKVIEITLFEKFLLVYDVLPVSAGGSARAGRGGAGRGGAGRGGAGREGGQTPCGLVCRANCSVPETNGIHAIPR